MCHFLNSFYTCTPAPRPGRVSNHSARTSVLCSSPVPCPPALWETRTQTWPQPCPDCAGETAHFSPPAFDSWSLQDAAAHDEAAARYVAHVARLLNATLLAHLPSSAAPDFLAAYPTLRAETLCREHGDEPARCACPAVGPRSWARNMASALRAEASAQALRAFASNRAVSAAIAGPLRDEVALTIQSVASRGAARDAGEGEEARGAEARVHGHLDPTRPVAGATVFSEEEAGRRLDFALSAQDVAASAVTALLAGFSWHAGKTAETAMLFRLQIARTFSLFAIADPGLSPLRADMVSERLAALVLDPVLTPAANDAADFGHTRSLIAALLPHFRPTSNGTLPSPFTSLYDALTRAVEAARAEHTRTLCAATHAHLAFRDATWPAEVDEFSRMEDTPERQRRKVRQGIPAPPALGGLIRRCPLARQGRCARRHDHPGAEEADPQDWHVPRVRVRHCGHVLGRRCAFVAGREAAARRRGCPLAWTCPACAEDDDREREQWEKRRAARRERGGEAVEAEGGRLVPHKHRHQGPERIVADTIVFKWPATAAMNGEMERAVMAQVGGETFPGPVRKEWEKRERAKAKA